MIISRLHSGLGNQMFQYAMGRRVATQLGADFGIDLSLQQDPYANIGHPHRLYALDIFQLEPNFWPSKALTNAVLNLGRGGISRSYRQVLNWRYPVLQEPHFHVAEHLLALPPDNRIYRGYWQSERYFQAIAPLIRQSFRFREGIAEGSKYLLDQIQMSPAVCLNVRRQEFLQLRIHNVTTTGYFTRSAKFIAERVNGAHFFIFSDDLDWCRAHLDLPYPHTFVGEEHFGTQFGNYLQLMIACQHFIIPNSSFAWWAAWLGEQNGSLVICPKPWFNGGPSDARDLIPARWQQIVV